MPIEITEHGIDAKVPNPEYKTKTKTDGAVPGWAHLRGTRFFEHPERSKRLCLD